MFTKIERHTEVTSIGHNVKFTRELIDRIDGLHHLQYKEARVGMAIAADGDEMVLILSGCEEARLFARCRALQALFNRVLVEYLFSEQEWEAIAARAHAALDRALEEDEDRIEFYTAFSQKVTLRRDSDGELRLEMPRTAFATHITDDTTTCWIAVKRWSPDYDVIMAKHYLQRQFIG